MSSWDYNCIKLNEMSVICFVNTVCTHYNCIKRHNLLKNIWIIIY